MAPKYLTALKSLTLGQAFRMITTACAAILFVWSFSGPFVKSYAADAFVQMLKENGMDPADFADIKKQSEKAATSIQSLSTDTDKIKGQIGDVGRKVERVADQIEDQNKSIDKVEQLLNDLIKIQLRGRRADSSFSPPGTGPTGIPQLGSVQ